MYIPVCIFEVSIKLLGIQQTRPYTVLRRTNKKKYKPMCMLYCISMHNIIIYVYILVYI